ncbi:hypothetical protein DER44DRAFT_753012 [Fusarium oxysporum]|nr:hypothetical protein DER44DRAFT_753012 [Fusarium oxysporum]
MLLLLEVKDIKENRYIQVSIYPDSTVDIDIISKDAGLLAGKNYVIIAKSAQKDVVRLQKEKLELEARRIRNPDRGAYTIRQLRGIVSDRAKQELQITNKRQAKDQEAWCKQLRKEVLPKEDKKPKLRGRAAAEVKASRDALEAARWKEIHKTFTDPNTIEEQRRQLQRWKVAHKEERFLMITTVPKSHLEAIPNLEKWVEENSRLGETNEAEVICSNRDRR